LSSSVIQVKEQLDERAKSDPTLALMTKIDNAPYHAMHPDKLSDGRKNTRRLFGKESFYLAKIQRIIRGFPVTIR